MISVCHKCGHIHCPDWDGDDTGYCVKCSVPTMLIGNLFPADEWDEWDDLIAAEEFATQVQL